MKSRIVLLLCCLTVGCKQDGPPKVIVEGQVTYAGQTVANGEIRFYPIGETSGAVSGGPIKDGRYVARAKGGVPVGEHRVDIRGFRAARSRSGSEDIRLEGGPAVQYLPDRYNEKSQLTVTIEGRKRVTRDFDLAE